VHYPISSRQFCAVQRFVRFLEQEFFMLVLVWDHRRGSISSSDPTEPASRRSSNSRWRRCCRATLSSTPTRSPNNAGPIIRRQELAVERVRHRVAAGGHHVPENKIRERYQRLWSHVATAIIRCDSATVYDNSGLTGPRIVAQFNDGFCIGSPAWPAWTPDVLRSACMP
jgi:hypothetical protein